MLLIVAQFHEGIKLTELDRMPSILTAYLHLGSKGFGRIDSAT